MKHLRRAKLQKQIEVDIQQDWTEILHKSMAVQEFTIDARDDYSAVLREELLRAVGELAKNLQGLRTRQLRVGLLATGEVHVKSKVGLDLDDPEIACQVGKCKLAHEHMC